MPCALLEIGEIVNEYEIRMARNAVNTIAGKFEA